MGEDLQQRQTSRGIAVAEPAPASRHASATHVAFAPLPEPSQAARSLNAVLTTTPVDLNELGKLVRANGVLAGQILKLVNSSLFNLPRPVSSVEQSVVAIGADNLRTLALTCGLVEWVAAKLPADDAQAFWRHSFLTALFSQRIAQWILVNAAEQAYLAGFLHDIGRVPLLLAVPAGAMPPLTPADRWVESVDLELQVFGISHCELGRDLALAWGFPLAIVEVLAFHHASGFAPAEAPLVRIVAAADQFASAGRDADRPGDSSAAARLASERILDGHWPGLSRKTKSGLIDALDADFYEATRNPKSASPFFEPLTGR